MHRYRTLIVLGSLVLLPLIAAVVAARYLLPGDDRPALAQSGGPAPRRRHNCALPAR